jgi:hypothetical protein
MRLGSIPGQRRRRRTSILEISARELGGEAVIRAAPEYRPEIAFHWVMLALGVGMTALCLPGVTTDPGAITMSLLSLGFAAFIALTLWADYSRDVIERDGDRLLIRTVFPAWEWLRLDADAASVTVRIVTNLVGDRPEVVVSDAPGERHTLLGRGLEEADVRRLAAVIEGAGLRPEGATTT